MSAIDKLSDEAIAQLAIDLEVQLERGTAERPVLYMLVQARKRAAEALTAMVLIDPSDVAALRALQNEVKLFEMMVQSCRALLSRGVEADQTIEERDREDIYSLTIHPDDLTLLGIHGNNKGYDQ